MKNRKTICPICRNIRYIKNYDDSIKKTCGNSACAGKLRKKTRDGRKIEQVDEKLYDQLKNTFIGVDSEDVII